MRFTCTDDIIQVLKAHDLKFARVKPTLYPADYIFDETKSIEWNAEERDRRNSVMLEIQEVETRKRISARLDIYGDIYAFIREALNFKISDVAAQAIWERVYKSEASHGYEDAMDELEDLITFLQLILEGEKENL